MLRYIVALVALFCSACLAAKDKPGNVLAFDRPETAAAGSLELSSPAFAQGAAIPRRFSAYGDGISPPLAWSGVPAGAASLVLMVEDPDAVSVRPYLHWVAWNIDPRSPGLPEGAGSGTGPQVAGAMVEGTNTRGETGYFGPKPSGSKPHRYVFQLFALDSRLTLDPAAKRSEVIGALAGHVIAKGQFIGHYSKGG